MWCFVMNTTCCFLWSLCVHCLPRLSSLSLHKPESVSDAVLKVHKSLFVYLQEVAAVEVEVSLHKHVPQLLLLSLLLAPDIAVERCFFFNLTHKQASFPCGRKQTRGFISIGTWKSESYGLRSGEDKITFRDFNTESSGVSDWLLFLCVVSYEGVRMSQLKFHNKIIFICTKSYLIRTLWCKCSRKREQMNGIYLTLWRKCSLPMAPTLPV